MESSYTDTDNYGPSTVTVTERKSDRSEAVNKMKEILQAMDARRNILEGDIEPPDGIEDYDSFALWMQQQDASLFLLFDPMATLLEVS